MAARNVQHHAPRSLGEALHARDSSTLQGWGTVIPLGPAARLERRTGVRVTDVSEFRARQRIPNEAIGLGFFLGVSLSAIATFALTSVAPEMFAFPVLVGVGFISLVLAVYCYRMVL